MKRVLLNVIPTLENVFSLKLKFLLIILGVLFGTGVGVNAQFQDDMESYTDGSMIFVDHWTDFNGTGSKALYSSSVRSVSGELSGYVPPNGTTDAILDLGNKSSGNWGLKFMMYIPSGREGYFNIQGNVPPGSNPIYAVGDIFFNKNNSNPGNGYVSYSTTAGSEWSTFSFPHDQWFEVIFNFAFGYTNYYQLIIDGEVYVDWHTYSRYIGPGQIQETNTLGGFDFYSLNSNCEYWLDDFNFINGHFEPGTCTNTTSSIVATSCNEYISPSGELWTESGLYEDIIPNVAGCDSIITVDLTITPNLIPSIIISSDLGTEVCEGDEVTLTAIPTNGGTNPQYQWKKNGNNVGTNQSTYIPSTLGEGDVITCELTSDAACTSPTNATSNVIAMSVSELIIPNFVQLSAQCIGSSFTLPTTSQNGINGSWSPNVNTQETTTYTFTPDSDQCSETATMTVEIIFIDNDVTVNENTLTAVETNATYQWIDCETDQAIPGATDISFTPDQSGLYSVEITKNGCTELSNCYSISVSALSKNSYLERINVFPNPFDTEIKVQGENIVGERYLVYDVLGNIIAQGDITQSLFSIPMKDISKGIYILKIGGYSVNILK